MTAKNRISLSCKNCGKTFETIPSVIARGRGKFCNRLCCDKWKVNHVVERFWSGVNKFGHPKGCWIWTRYRDEDGYGHFNIHRKDILAHRFSWMIHNSLPIPDGMLICHDCDNPPCVNPDHLFIGTHQDNRQDAVNKGRTAKGDKSGMRLHPGLLQGEKHGNAKLTTEQVIEIRRLKHTLSSRQLSERHGVTQAYIRAIILGLSWKHIPLDP